MKQIVAAGTTDYTVLAWLGDSSVTTGAGQAGVAYDDITVYYARVETDNDVTSAVLATSALANLTAAHADGGWYEVDGTHQPGLYRLDLPDAVFAAGAWSAVVTIIDAGANDIRPATLEFQIQPVPAAVSSIAANAITATAIAADAITASELATTAVAEIVDAVWDEPLTSGTHDVGYSAGQRLRYLILSGAAAQAGSSNSITLANTESSTDNIFNQNIISIVSGTGAGQTRLIAEYNGTSKVATVDRAWDTNPASGSVYEILPFSSILLADHGTAQAGGASSITLASTASAVTNAYVGSVVYLSSGTGVGQARVITAYNGTSKVATISDNWTTTPDSTSVYKVLPVGRVILDSIGDTAKAEIQAEAEDALEAYDLDHLLQVSAGSEEPTDGSYLDQIMHAAAGQTFDATTDSLEAIRNILTSASVTGIASVSGNTISVVPYTTWEFTVTGLSDLSGALTNGVFFTVKERHTDADSAAILQVQEGVGLTVLNGSTSVTAAKATLTVGDDEDEITVHVNASQTGLSKSRSLVWDIKQVLTASEDADQMAAGAFHIVDAAVTRALTTS